MFTSTLITNPCINNIQTVIKNRYIYIIEGSNLSIYLDENIVQNIDCEKNINFCTVTNDNTQLFIQAGKCNVCVYNLRKSIYTIATNKTIFTKNFTKLDGQICMSTYNGKILILFNLFELYLYKYDFKTKKYSNIKKENYFYINSARVQNNLILVCTNYFIDIFEFDSKITQRIHFESRFIIVGMSNFYLCILNKNTGVYNLYINYHKYGKYFHKILSRKRIGVKSPIYIKFIDENTLLVITTLKKYHTVKIHDKSPEYYIDRINNRSSDKVKDYWYGTKSVIFESMIKVLPVYTLKNQVMQLEYNKRCIVPNKIEILNNNCQYYPSVMYEALALRDKPITNSAKSKCRIQMFVKHVLFDANLLPLILSFINIDVI